MQIQSLSNFSLGTRNVHKEVKDGMADLVKVLKCYVHTKKEAKKIRTIPGRNSTGSKCSTCERKSELKTDGTQTVYLSEPQRKYFPWSPFTQL